MIRRIGLVFLLGILSLGISIPNAISANAAPGSKCTKVGATAKSGASVVKCEKVKAKLIWQKVVTGRNSSSSGKSSSPVTKPVSTNPPLSGHGLLTIDCSSAVAAHLQLLNPTTGEILAQRILPLSLNNELLGQVGISLCDTSGTSGGASDLFIREQLSPDFSKVAFVSQIQANGSSHVGFLSLGTNNFTDITAKTMTSGFSASIPMDSSPIFDSANNKFFFLRGSATQSALGIVSTNEKEVHAFNLTTNEDSVLGTINAPDETGPDATNWITEQNGIVAQGNLLLSANGMFAAHTYSMNSGAVLFFGVTGPIASYTWDLSNLYPPGSYLDGNDAYANTEVFGWLGATDVAAFITGRTGIYRIPLNASNEVTVTPANLLPESTATNANAVISPDGGEMAFTHTLLSSIDLYTAPTDGGGTPKKIIGNFPGRLINWH